MNLFSEAVLQSWLSVAYPDTFPPGLCLRMQPYFRCLVTMLIPPLQVKDGQVKKTFSSDQLSSKRALTVPEPVLNLPLIRRG
jgi:hypothetical protein